MVVASADHIGLTVADLDRSAEFWGALLGVTATATEHLQGPQLGRLVGYPSARIDRRWVRLPGIIDVELLRYLDHDDPPYDAGTAHPGNVHICLAVEDMATAHAHALSCGAQVVTDGWIEVPAGPMAGTRIAYLRDPDDVTIELLQHPAPAVDAG